MPAKNSTKQTLLVALLLCLVCSVFVAGAAVALKPLQLTNKLLDRNKNILSTVGLFEAGKTSNAQVEERFKQFEAHFLDIRSGELLSEAQAKELGLNINTYDQRTAAKDPQWSHALTPEQDIASLGGSQAKYLIVYLLKEQGKIKRIVLPVQGYGLWGTLYGFMSIENDANTIAGLSFYEHKETPGLGAKVDLESWKALWPGKKIYDEKGQPQIHLAKSKAKAQDPHEVDGLSGATLTTNGVSHLLKFWMSDLGYKPFLDKLKKQPLQKAPSALATHQNLSAQRGANNE